jgi:hypothetical protein
MDYMITLDKKYETKKGYPVRIYCNDGAGQFPVHGAYSYLGKWYAQQWSLDGSCSCSGYDDPIIES